MFLSLGNLNCASFVAGIVEGVLCTSGFVCYIIIRNAEILFFFILDM